MQTVRKCCLKSGCKFITVIGKSPSVILPESFDFIVVKFTSKLRSSLDSVASLITKTVNTKSTALWRNKETNKLKRKIQSDGKEMEAKHIDNYLSNTPSTPYNIQQCSQTGKEYLLCQMNL